MLTLRFDIAEESVQIVMPQIASALEAVARLPRISGAHLLASDAGVSGKSTAESKDRKDILAQARWVVLLEGCDLDAFGAALITLHRFAEIRDAAKGHYLHEYTRLKTAWQAG